MAEESSRAWKDQYMLRLPDGMRDRIKAAAEANNRSMNAEIVARLEATFGEAGFALGFAGATAPPESDSYDEAVDEITKSLSEITDVLVRTNRRISCLQARLEGIAAAENS